MGVAAWLTDVTGKVEECNKTACSVSGYQRLELLGANLSELITKNDLHTTARAMKNALQGVVNENFDVSLLSKEGGEVRVSIDVSPRETRRLMTVGSMILAVRDNNASVLALLDRLGVAGWITDTQGVVDNCNNSASSMLDYRQQESIGKDLPLDLIAKENKIAITGAIVNAGKNADTVDIDMQVTIMPAHHKLNP